MNARITLREYERTEVGLTLEDQSIFLQDVEQRISISPTTVPGRVELSPNQYVGVIRLPSGITLDLLPKVPLHNVMWMVSEVERLEGIDFHIIDHDVHINTFDDILEPIANAFAGQVEHLIDRGLYRAYVEQEDNLPAIRGRIEFREDLNRNVVLRHRTYCRFSEFSWDIPENQVIRQVIRKLIGWGFSGRLTARLISLDRQMESVRPGNLRTHHIDRFQYSRQSEHYSPIHRYCRLFLDGFSLSEQVGDSPFSGFLMDMNVLFEQFVSILLEQEVQRIDRTLDVNRQASHRLFRNAPGSIRPDLVLEQSGQQLLVADTKYKRKVGTDADPGDYYQVITYCTVLGLANGVLIYPRHLADVDESLTVLGNDITIHETSIDLRTSRASVRQELHRLAWKVVQLGHTQRSALVARAV